MSEYTKQFYSIGEVSQMLDVPIYTLRFWEDEFPMFNPNRTPKGTRRFTPADIDMAKAIKSAVYDKGMRIEAAIVYLNKTYRKHSPRNPFKCNSPEEAIALLNDAKMPIEDAHVLARIDAVINYLNVLHNGGECAY